MSGTIEERVEKLELVVHNIQMTMTDFIKAAINATNEAKELSRKLKETNKE